MAVTDLGPTQLKNIDKQIRAYLLQVGVPSEAKRAEPVKPTTPQKRRIGFAPFAAMLAALVILIAGGAWWLLYANRPAAVAANAPAEAAHLSIVVLPFANLSDDPQQDYFADGITENLTTDLSRIRNSFVIARNTAFTFKGKTIDAKEIGKELGVRYVLEGSVQRDQKRVRVNAQLIDAQSGAHLWAERFEEDIADLFKLQDQVVARLANTLGNELINAEARRDVRIGNLDAFDLTMRGRASLLRFVQQPTRDNNNAARTLLEQALKLDPNDADALACDAATYMIDKALGWTTPDTDYDAKVLGQADRAIALDRDDVTAYYVKSEYLSIVHRPDEALRAADVGLAIDPNDSGLNAARGLAANHVGNFEQGKTDTREAMRLSPRDPRIGAWHAYLAYGEIGLGHLDAAIVEANKAVDAGFRVYPAPSFLAAAYALKGDMEEAKTALAEARRLNPKLTVKWMAELFPKNPALAEGLRKAGLPEE